MALRLYYNSVTYFWQEKCPILTEIVLLNICHHPSVFTSSRGIFEI